MSGQEEEAHPGTSGVESAPAVAGRPITARDVARDVGVSQSAVSLVFSGKSAGRISPATRRQIEEAAERLGYQPNRQARSLRTGSAGLIGFAVPDATHPFFGQMFVAADRAARESDQALTLIDSRSDPRWTGRLSSQLASRQLDGAIVYLGTAEVVEQLAPYRDRLLFVESADQAGLDLDIATAMGEAVGLLTGLGHRRFGYLRADYPSVTFVRRQAGYADALAAAGLVGVGWRSSSFDVDQATAAATDLLDGERPTAVLCDDDLLAAAAYRAARRLGLSVPGDVSIVGFGDLDLARFLDPELTTVSIPAGLLGERAVALLGSRPPAGPEVVRLDLVVRGSVAGPTG